MSEHASRASGAAHPYLAGGSRPRVFAHRGFVTAADAASGVVENSLVSLTAAVELGADYVETDCHLTSDGHVVLFHDADLTRVLGDARPLAETPMRELRAMMSDRGGLLALEEALEAFPHTRFNIDVKAEAAAAPLGRIVAPHRERVLVTSFSDEFRIAALRAAAQAADGSRPATSPGRSALIRILLALATRSEPRITRALAGFDALQIPERQGPLRILTPRLLDAAHRHSVEVHVWTVNDPQAMLRLAQLGVDGVISDRADLALTVLARHRGQP